MHHPRSIGTALDTLDPYSWQPKQQCRTVRHSPWFLPSPECFATLRLQKAKGLLLQRHAHESEITTARLNFKSRYTTAMRLVVVPQGIRRVLPALVNQFIALLKASALVYFLGLIADQRELFQVGRDLNAQTGNLSPLVAAGLFYLILTIPLTHLVNYIDTRLRRGRRAPEPEDNSDMLTSTFGQEIT